MRWWLRLLGWCAALLAAPLASADDGEAAPSRFEFGVDASGLYGPISGFVQVPLGGNPGTTSARRPTFRELGIDDAASWAVEGWLRWGHFVVSGGYAGMDLSGSSTLSEPLVSHGVAFPAGSPTHSSIGLDVAHLGVGWRFELFDGRLSLLPKLDFALLDFSYSLDAPGARASRAYRDGGVRLGGQAVYDLGHGFSAELDGVASLPIEQTPQLAGVEGRLAYQPFPTSSVRAKLFLGCAARWIDFEDAQALPNHLDVRYGPLVTGGLTVWF